MSELVYRRPCEQHGVIGEHEWLDGSGAPYPENAYICKGGVEIVLDPERVLGVWFDDDWTVRDILDVLDEETE